MGSIRSSGAYSPLTGRCSNGKPNIWWSYQWKVTAPRASKGFINRHDALYIHSLTKVWPHSFTISFLHRAGPPTHIPSMTAYNNITVVPPSGRTPSATVSSPVAGFIRSAVHRSCPTANSADGRGIDEDKVTEGRTLSLGVFQPPDGCFQIRKGF